MAEGNNMPNNMSSESKLSEDMEEEDEDQPKYISPSSAIDLALMSKRSDIPRTEIPYMPQTLLEPLSGTMAYSQPPVVNQVNRAAAKMMMKSVDSIVRAGYVPEGGNQVASSATEQMAMATEDQPMVPMLPGGKQVGIYPDIDTENSSLQTIPDISENSALQTMVS